MRSLIFLIIPFICLAKESLNVRVYHTPPNVIVNSGDVTGFDVDVLREILADDYELKFHETKNFVDLLDTNASRFDISAGAVTITGDRMKNVDFSYPYLQSGLQILVRSDKRVNVFKVIWNYINRTFYALLVFGVFLFGCSVLIWWLEKGYSSFNDSFWKGIGDGIYWTNTTMTTVGYGDKTPTTTQGKIFAVIVMWIGIAVIYPYFISSMGVSMSSEESYAISSVNDLTKRQTIATQKFTTSNEYVVFNVPSKQFYYESLMECFDELETGKVDAVVHDMPTLKYYAATNKKVRVVGKMFDEQYYGYVLHKCSPLKDLLDKRLIDFMRTPKYEKIKKKWL